VARRFDGSAASVAKLLANSGFKGAFAIKGGAEGPNGWKVRGTRNRIITLICVLSRCIRLAQSGVAGSENVGVDVMKVS